MIIINENYEPVFLGFQLQAQCDLCELFKGQLQYFPFWTNGDYIFLNWSSIEG